MRSTSKPAVWLALLAVGLGLTLAGCNTISTTSVIDRPSLSITISGLPNGVSGDVVVTGPNAYRTTIAASTTLTRLAVGTYRIAPQRVNSTYAYIGQSSSSTVDVTAGSAQSDTVTYRAGTGAIRVYWLGQMNTITFSQFQFTVTGNGVHRVETIGTVASASTADVVTVSDLPGGSYAIYFPPRDITSCGISGSSHGIGAIFNYKLVLKFWYSHTVTVQNGGTTDVGVVPYQAGEYCGP